MADMKIGRWCENLYHSKYKAKKVTTEDGTFDSKKELKRWEELKAMLEAGQIRNLQRQVEYELLPKQVLITKRGRLKCELPVKYKADFVYEADGKTVVEDVKGFRTKEYMLKRKMMKFFHDIEIKEV